MEWEETHIYKGRMGLRLGLKYINKHWIKTEKKRKRHSQESDNLCECASTGEALCSSVREILGIVDQSKIEEMEVDEKCTDKHHEEDPENMEEEGDISMTDKEIMDIQEEV